MRTTCSLILFLCLTSFLPAEQILVNEPTQRKIFLRQNQVWKLPPFNGKGSILIDFEHRIDFPRLGGWTSCWQILVNDRLITPMATRQHTRLLNKPTTAMHLDHGQYSVSVGEKWYSLYSPDYQSGKSRFSPPDPQAYRVLIDITDQLSSKHENNITIRFGSELTGYYKSLGLKRKPSLVIRNFKIIHDDKISKLPKPLQEPTFITMKEVPQPEFQVESSSDAFVIKCEKRAFPIFSRFSASGNKWFTMGKQDKLQTPDYRVTRKIVRHTNRLDIFDSFTSTSDKLIGIKIKYETPLDDASAIYLAGDPAPSRSQNNGGRNPSMFLSHRDIGQGLGIIAQDDVFRVQNIQYCNRQRTGIRSDTFALSPNEMRTVEWSVYPIMSWDYFDFINQVRQDWQVNFTIQGGFHLSMTSFRTWNEQQAQNFHRDVGLAVNSTGVLYWAHIGGKYAHRSRAIHGAALMDEWVRGHDAHNNITKYKVEPMRQFIRDIMAKARKYTPEVKRFIYVHNQISSEIGDLEKYHDCVLTREDGTPITDSPYNYFIPTAENKFGKNFMTFIEYLFDNFDIDGIYHDEFTYTRRLVTYNIWDGVSVQIDDQGNVDRKIGFVPLLKLKYNMALMDYVINQRKKGFIANFAPETRSERQFHFPRFEETYNSWWVFLSHLYTPIQLGDMLTYGVTAKDCMADIRNAMKNGALYYHYNNQAACPTITAQMYPFTPLQIHSGWLLAKERILTIYNGEYGWPEQNALCLPIVYDTIGKATQNFQAEIIPTSQGNRCRLNMQPKHCAALIRLPIDAQIDGEVILSDIKCDDNIFTCNANGKGNVTLSQKNNKLSVAVDGREKIRWLINK